MRSAWKKMLGLLAMAGCLAIGGATAGCQSERATVNRIQATPIKKADLVGDNYMDPTQAPEWYMRNTIIGVQRTNPFFSDGLQDIVRRVRYEIQEQYLIVRDAYEYVANSDGHGAPAGKTNNGAIVAMYPITSHFDIKQGYNQVTGENLNFYEENTTDRVWYEREYIHVDWSQNLVNDPNFFEVWYPKAFGELHAQPVQYFEEDPRQPDASNFAELSSGYMDVTSRWVVQAGTTSGFQDDYGFWHSYGLDLPQCLLTNFDLNPSMATEGSIECNDQEIVIRTSMMKVPVGDQSTDYEAREVDGQSEQIVGAFYQQRLGYDREYGVTDKTWHWWLIRYNIWQKSHVDSALDDSGNVVHSNVCGADDDKGAADAYCSGAFDPNSYCDMNAKLCTIPFTNRTVRPIAFYVDHDLPTQLLPSTQRAVDDWNQALRMAVAVARESECRRLTDSADSRDACHARFFVVNGDLSNPDTPSTSIPDVAVMCHNPVVAADSPACDHDKKDADGNPVVRRKGDIRHHMIAWWPNPSFEAPLGVVVLGQDPLTGEHVTSMANIFGDGMESAISIYRDWIQLANGDFSPSDYVNGLPEQLYGTATVPMPNDPKRDPSLDAMHAQWARKKTGEGMSGAEMKARLHGIDPTSTVNRLGMAKALEGLTTVDQKMEAVKAYIAKMGVLGTPSFGGWNEFKQKLDHQTGKLIKSGMESQAANSQWDASLGLDPSSATNPGVVGATSPLEDMSPAMADMVDATWRDHWEQYPGCRYPSNVWKIAYGHFDGVAAKFKARYPDGGTASGPLADMAGVTGQTIDRVVRGKLIYWELFNVVYTDVLEHEMGHNFSEDHDFGASWDSVNYFPQYWTMRAHGVSLKDPTNAACDPNPATPRKPTDPDNCMGPRYLDPETTDELGTTPGNEHDQISAYSVSSFMDYHEDSRYWGPSGLGQYDKMAAKFIYGNVVELFDDEDKSLITGVHSVAYNIKSTLVSMLGGDWQYNFNSPVGTFSQPMHYTEIARRLNLFDPRRCRPSTPDEDASGVAQYHLVCAPVQRDHAFVRDMVTENVKDGSQTDYLGYWRTRDGYEGCSGPNGASGCKIRWPYKYGPSHFANYPHIAVFDQGADFYEVTNDAINWHLLHNAVGFYRAGRREWNPMEMRWHIYRSHYNHMHLLAWDAINSATRDASFFPGTAIDANPIATSDDWGRPAMIAMTQLFDLFQDELLRPQPGGYDSPATLPGQSHPLYGVPLTGVGSEFQLGALDASYIDNEYDQTQGYQQFAYMRRLGHYAEKPLAAIGLVDSRPPLSIVARDTYLDGRNVMFSFRSAMPLAVDRLFAGVFAQDWDTVAPYTIAGEPVEDGMSPLHSVKLWNFDGAAITRPAGAKLVDPMLGYATQQPSMLFTLLYQPIDSNMELVNRARVWVEGGPEGVTVPDDQKVSFYDPADGLTWGASKFGTEVLDGKTVEIGIGARMLNHANDLLAAAYNVKVDASGTVVYGTDHRPVIDPTSSDPTKLTIKDADASEKLKQYVGLLNVTRQLLWYLGFGPLDRGWDSPDF
jgi:hypothetical protein